MAKDNVLSIAGRGSGKDGMTEVPPAPKHLNKLAKEGYKMMGDFLLKCDRLKEYYLPQLEIWAVAYGEWAWACDAINKKNTRKAGSGYIQVFKTGASNITTEMSVRNAAADTMLKCAKLFGLEPKAEKDLKGNVDPNQGMLDFENFYNQKNAQ